MNAGSAAGDHLAHMSFCYLLIAARHGGGPLGMSLVSRAADAAPDSGRTGPDLAASGTQNPPLCTSEGLLHPASIAAQAAVCATEGTCPITKRETGFAD